MFVSPKMKKNIKLAAADPLVQKVVLEAMFDGCEMGTDIWENLEGENFSASVKDALFGPNQTEAETAEEERLIVKENSDFGAVYYGGHDAAVLLIQSVRDNLLKKL